MNIRVIILGGLLSLGVLPVPAALEATTDFDEEAGEGLEESEERTRRHRGDAVRFGERFAGGHADEQTRTAIRENMVGASFASAGKLREARHHFDLAARLAPGEPVIWNNLATLAALEGDNELARTLYDNALAIEPGFLLAERNLEIVERRLDGRE